MHTKKTIWANKWVWQRRKTQDQYTKLSVFYTLAMNNLKWNWETITTTITPKQQNTKELTEQNNKY